MIIQTSSPKQIITLNKEKKEGTVLIWFYAVWCDHCHNMEQDWDKLSNNHPKGIKLAKIESSSMNNYKMSPNETQMRGYPTLRLYDKDEMVKEYDGDRSFGSMYEFIEKYLKSKLATKRNNLTVVRSRRGNTINSKLLNAISKYKKKSKVPKRTMKKVKPLKKKKKKKKTKTN